ncbi:carboxypeptidase-like regulatory domain-containing protein [Flavobacterium subsaxonicum]|nr:carboxypeptidase-like regulatory domain-containing protein [Flavobacterium subsaxonicum]
MKKITSLIALTLLLFVQNAVSQSVTGTVIDEQKQPIPYVSIQVGPTYGVVSNTEGQFVINIPSPADADKVIFSSIGYESIAIPLSDFKSGAYVLKEQVTVLDPVFITNKKLSPLEILAQVKINAPKNYGTQPAKQTFFLRNSYTNKMIDGQFELVKSSVDKKATLKELNKEIEDVMKKLKNQSSKSYSESYGFLYQQNSESKLLVEKAVELKNRERDVSGEQAQSKFIDIVKRYLDPNATYKLKTGLFTIDDSLKVKSAKKDIKPDVKTAYLKTTITALSSSLNNFYTKDGLDFFTDYKRYTYTLEGYSEYNDETIYILDFKPAKSSGHYYGKIYVNALDYAVVKLEYNLVDGENESKINLKLLLGVKMMEDRTKVAATFTKNDAGQYSINFIKKQKGNYGYMDRSLKFTKNKVSKDEETNMLKVDFLIESDTYTTSELFIIDKQPITAAEFKNVTEKEKYDINYIAKYDPSIWKDYNVLAPVDAIKNYN